MAMFKCKHTGCVYEMTDEEIIKDMRKHSEYEEVIAVKQPPKPKKAKE